MNISKTLLLFFTLIPLSIFAQKTKDYKWNSPNPRVEIQKEFEEEDALIIFEDVYYSRLYTGGTFSIVDRVHRRIRINSQLGLEEHTRVTIPNYKDLQIKHLDARTIKADGRIVDLESKDIKQIGLSEEVLANTNVSRYLLFAIPGVELGDEIEIYLSYEGKSIDRGGNYYFHRQAPALSSKFTIEVSNEIGLNVRVYNDLKNCAIDAGIRSTNYTWELTNTPGLYASEGAILPLVYPYLCYELDYSNLFYDAYVKKSDNWATLLSFLNTELFDLRVRKYKDLDQQYDRILRGYEGLSKLEKIEAFHRYVNKEMKLRRLESTEESNGVEYFLENNVANEIYLMGIYKNMLEYMDVNAFLAVGKSRYDGPIDLHFPSIFQVSRLFFVFEDEQSNLHFLIPKDNESSYKLDELPTEFEGTKMYMVDFEDEEIFKEISLPPGNSKYNACSRKGKIKVNLKEPDLTINVQANLKGGAYQESKQNYELFSKEEKTNTFSEALQKQLPEATLNELSFLDNEGKKSEINYSFNLPNRILKLEDDLFQISIESLFEHQLHKLHPKRTLDYYPSYPGQDSYNYFFIFDQDIELLNRENLVRFIDTNHASYSLSLTQPQKNVLQISSKYILKKNKISELGFKELQEVNKAAEMASSGKLMIRVLK